MNKLINQETFDRLKKEVSPMQNDIIRYGFIPLEAREKNILYYIIHKINRLKLTNKKQITQEEYDSLSLQPAIIELSQMVKDLGLGKHYEVVRNSLEKLSGTSIRLKYPNSKRETFIPIISKADYKPEDGVIEVKFNQEAKPFLLPNPNTGNFTEIGTLPTSMFKFKYSSDLYSMLKMQKQLFKKEIKISMEDIFLKFRLADYYKKDFNRFKTKILDKILEDLNSEYCDILVSNIKYEKTGKRISDLVFEVAYNKTFFNKKKEDTKKEKPTTIKKEVTQNNEPVKETSSEESYMFV